MCAAGVRRGLWIHYLGVRRCGAAIEAYVHGFPVVDAFCVFLAPLRSVERLSLSQAKYEEHPAAAAA